MKKRIAFFYIVLAIISIGLLGCEKNKTEQVTVPNTIVEDSAVSNFEEEPVTEAIEIKEPVVEEPIIEEPVIEEPSTESTAAEDPAVENTVDEIFPEFEEGHYPAWYDLVDYHANQPDLAADGEFKNLTIQPGNEPNQLHITWFSKSSSRGKVTFEAEDDSLFSNITAKATTEPSISVPGYYRNSALIENLESNSVYYYTLENGGNKSPVYKYKTKDLYSTDFTFTVAGDPEIGLGDEEVWAGHRSMWRVVLNRMKAQIPESSFLVTTGDQVANPSSSVHYDYFLDNSLLYSMPLVPVVGNHDNGTGYFGDHFTLPNRDSLGTASGRDGNYWFVKGNTLFMVLNSLCPQDFDDHEEFVRNVTRSHPHVKWKILISHYSPITMVERYQGIREAIKEDYAELGEDYDIDLFIGGHDHIYTRGYFLDEEGDPIVDNDLRNEYNNPGHPVYMIVNGATDALLRNPDEDYEWSAISVQNQVPQLTKVHVSNDCIQVTTRDADHWEIVDDFTIYKD